MKTILTAVAAAAIAVCAQAQQGVRKVAPAGQDYTIGSVMAASGSNVTYQWFRDGQPIAGATSASYTVPASLAKHENGLIVRYTHGSRFQRAAYGIDCAGGVAMSNSVTVYFCDLMVNGVCWARANSNNVALISSNPWDDGALYQWNMPSVGYSTTAGTLSGFSATPDLAATWTNGVPCPAGWRLPTKQDCENLLAASQPVGGVWVEGGVRGIPAGVNGSLLGYNTNFCTMTNMAGCVFLPASGFRTGASGTNSYYGRMGRYWASEHNSFQNGVTLYVTETDNGYVSYAGKTGAETIRCVQDVQ